MAGSRQVEAGLDFSSDIRRVSVQVDHRACGIVCLDSRTVLSISRPLALDGLGLGNRHDERLACLEAVLCVLNRQLFVRQSLIHLCDVIRRINFGGCRNIFVPEIKIVGLH